MDGAIFVNFISKEKKVRWLVASREEISKLPKFSQSFILKNFTYQDCLWKKNERSNENSH